MEETDVNDTKMEVEADNKEEIVQDGEEPDIENESYIKNEKSRLAQSILRSTIQGCASVDELQKALRSLALKAQDVKTQIYSVICKEYTQFFSTVNTSSDQNERLRDLVIEMKTIGQQLESELKPEIHNATASYKDLTKEYNQTAAIAETLEKLLQIQGHLEQIPKCIETKDFCSAASLVNEIRDHMASLSSDKCETKVFKAVREEYRIQKNQLRCGLEENWEKLIKWKIPTAVSWSKIESHLNSSLSISQGSKEDIGKTLHGMHILGILDSRLKTLGKKLLTYLIKPVIIFQGLNPAIKKTELYLQKGPIKGKQINNTETVFSKVLFILQYINSLLSQPTVEKSQEEVLNPLQMIGVSLWPELADLIITECLAKAVPTAGSQLDSYMQVIESTKGFEEALFKIGFVKESCHDLLVYVKDINVHFANRKCQDLLAEARSLMTSEIHNMIKIERQKDRASIPVGSAAPDVNEKMPQELKRLLLGLTEIPKELLGTKTFVFPECRVSESTKKVMDIAYRTLVEATEAHDAVAVQLFYAVRNVFELFIHVVPSYHKENLKLPQIAALQYTNAMYLAHHCMTLGHQYKRYLPETLRRSGATFVDLVPDLRRVGEQCLQDQQKIQRRILIDIIDTCEGFVDCSTGSRSNNIERALTQIVHQLVHLSKLWKDVLPENIYLRCLGNIFSSVLEEIVTRMMQIEFISADDATLLHSHLKILSQRAVEVFNPKPSENEEPDMGFIVHVPNWQKYNELVGILEASLQDIVDRWADGKGPLAETFDANEVRNFIRALFQNTDRRAKALARIKQSKDT